MWQSLLDELIRMICVLQDRLSFTMGMRRRECTNGKPTAWIWPDFTLKMKIDALKRCWEGCIVNRASGGRQENVLYGIWETMEDIIDIHSSGKDRVAIFDFSSLWHTSLGLTSSQ